MMEDTRMKKEPRRDVSEEEEETMITQIRRDAPPYRRT